MGTTHTPDNSSTARSQWDRNGFSKGILIGLLVSIVLHLAFVFSLFVASLLGFNFSLKFDESASIGFMKRAGLAEHGGDQQTAPRYTHVIDITPPPKPAGPDAPTDEELAQMAAAQAQAQEEQAAAEKQQAEQQQAQEAEQKRLAEQQRAERKEKERQAQVSTAANTSKNSAAASAGKDSKSKLGGEKSDGDSQSAKTGGGKGDDKTTPTASKADGNDAASASAQGDAGPRYDLPPGERYPQGTINPIATDLSMWGPEGAQLVVVVRNDRLRTSPHADDVRSVLHAFPDWRTLIGGANLDPLNEIDTTVIASANPKYINQTFLAAMHHIPNKRVVETLSQGEHGGVKWSQKNDRLIGDVTSTRGQDPRQFYIPSDGILIFSQPKFLNDLSSGVAPPQDAKALLEFANLSHAEQVKQLETTKNDLVEPKVRRPRSSAPKRDRGWLKGLSEIASYGGTSRKGLVAMVSTGKVSGMRIQGYRGTMPESIHADIYGDSDVRITGRMIFKNKSEAEAFQKAWPDILNANRSSLNLVGLYTPLNNAELSIDHNELIFELEIAKRAVHRMAVSISQLMKMR